MCYRARREIRIDKTNTHCAPSLRPPPPSPGQLYQSGRLGQLVSHLRRETPQAHIPPKSGPRTSPSAWTRTAPGHFLLFMPCNSPISKHLHFAGCCPPCTADMKLHVTKASHSHSDARFPAPAGLSLLFANYVSFVLFSFPTTELLNTGTLVPTVG